MVLEILAVSIALLLCGGLAGYLYHQRLFREQSDGLLHFDAVNEYLSKNYGITLSDDERETIVNTSAGAKARVESPKMLGPPKDR